MLNLLSHVECINPGTSWLNGNAFAALKEDGTVAAWGSSSYEGSGVPSGLSNVRAIYSTYYAFAALKEVGTVAAWGNSEYGGSGVPSGLSDVRTIYSTNAAFAALKEDGTVTAWGSSYYGGNNTFASGLSNVKTIYSTESAFAALKEDGTVAAWGYSPYGGSDDVPSGLSNTVRVIFGSTAVYSDSTSTQLLSLSTKILWERNSTLPRMSRWCNIFQDEQFSLAIRSVIGSCIICDRGSFSVDWKTCINIIPVQRIIPLITPDVLTDGTLSGCRACNYTGFYRNLATNSCERCPKGKYSDGSGFIVSMSNWRVCPSYWYGRMLSLCYTFSSLWRECSSLPYITRRLYIGCDCYRDCPAGKYGLLGDMLSNAFHALKTNIPIHVEQSNVFFVHLKRAQMEQQAARHV